MVARSKSVPSFSLSAQHLFELCNIGSGNKCLATDTAQHEQTHILNRGKFLHQRGDGLPALKVYDIMLFRQVEKHMADSAIIGFLHTGNQPFWRRYLLLACRAVTNRSCLCLIEKSQQVGKHLAVLQHK